MSQLQGANSDERRRFFRVTDHVIINYRVIDQGQLDQGIVQLKANRMGRDHIQSAMLGMETRLQDLITVIGRARPDFAEAIDLLNKKISLVERMLNASRDDIDEAYLNKPSSEVCLSAGGLSFHSPKEAIIDTLLEIELVLLPEYSYIKTYAKVVSCAAEENGDGYKVGVEYEFIREDDQEDLVHHVLNKQSQELMQKRLEEGGIPLP